VVVVPNFIRIFDHNIAGGLWSRALEVGRELRARFQTSCSSVLNYFACNFVENPSLVTSEVPDGSWHHHLVVGCQRHRCPSRARSAKAERLKTPWSITP